MADRGLNGNGALNYRGVRASTPPQLVIHPRAPGVHDYLEYCIGDIWLDSSRKLLTPPLPPRANDIWMLTSVARNIATWVNFAGGELITLTGDTGLPVHGDPVNFNIDLHSGIANMSFDGNPATHTIVLNSTGGGPLAESFTTDDANVVVPTAAGNVNVFGADGITTTGAIANTITIHAGGTIANHYTTDAGIATPAANNLNVLGIHGINTSAPGAASTIDVAINNTITLGDLAVVTTGLPSVTLTSGDLTLSGTGVNAAANINMPVTNSAGDQGIYKVGGNRFISNFGTSNTFVGTNSGNTTLTAANATWNTGFGEGTLSNITTAFANTACGENALNALTTGEGNIGVGRYSLLHCTTTIHNVGIGYQSMVNVTTGNNNVGVGTNTLSDLITGSQNIAIGINAGDELTGAETGNIIIGHRGIIGDNGIIRIGNDAPNPFIPTQTKCFIKAIRGVTTDVVDAIPVLIDSASQLGTVSSSIRYKDNVEDMGDSSDNVLNLRPVTFEYKKHPGKVQYGLIAEEVEQVMPRLVVYDSDGLPETVKYHELPAILLNEMQKLVKRIDQLEKNLQKYEEL